MPYLSKIMSINKSKLEETVSKLMAPKKGILAADESTNSIKARFKDVGIVSTPEKIREFRSILVMSPGIENYIGGVILYDETFRQYVDGTKKTFPEYLHSKGIMVGIKVDRGTKQMPGSKDEKITEGLDGLRERFIEYHDLGADFAKWRALFKIDTQRNFPSSQCIDANCHSLIMYSLLAQEVSIVPIQEPEVDMAGNHTKDDCYRVTHQALDRLYKMNVEYGVYLPGMILKPNFILDGKDYEPKTSFKDLAWYSKDVIISTFKNEEGGDSFLSGGLSDNDSGSILNETNKIKRGSVRKTFSYGRACQRSALEEYARNPQNVGGIQKIFLEKARNYSLASEGLL